MSMAAGEYVSVSSQADTEQRGSGRERGARSTTPQPSRASSLASTCDRGLEPTLAPQVAEQLMAHDALAAHARDELGMTEALRARPIQAALASAATFAVGAALPLGLLHRVAAAGWSRPSAAARWCASPCSARWRRGSAGRDVVGAARVTFWGALAMAVTAAIGALFGATPA